MGHDPENGLSVLALGRIAELRDGTKVRLRLVGPDDREELVLGFEHLSPESRYLRFFAPLAQLPASLVDRMLDTDDCNHIAIGAELPHSDGAHGLLGVARFIRLADEPDSAELAVAVADEFQRRGLGTLLLRELLRVASGVGVRRFRAHILPENHAVRELLRSLGLHTPVGSAGDALIFEIPLPYSRVA